MASSSSDHPMPVIRTPVKLTGSEFCASVLPNGEVLRPYTPLNSRLEPTTVKVNRVPSVGLRLKPKEIQKVSVDNNNRDGDGDESNDDGDDSNSNNDGDGIIVP